MKLRSERSLTRAEGRKRESPRIVTNLRENFLFLFIREDSRFYSRRFAFPSAWQIITKLCVQGAYERLGRCGV
jgi:hypothetical protein